MNETTLEDDRLPPRFATTRRMLAVASGKGGVGKSTVATNLALALVQTGLRVGLLDGDVHGPNVPLMLGVRRNREAIGWEAFLPIATAADSRSHEHNRMPALERYGLKVMSLGLLVGEDQAVLTDNAPLVGLLVRGLLDVVEWGELDILVIDLPPGTGEPLATLLKTVRMDGVVLVTTPQDVARLDTGRALEAFRTAGVPVLGVVENMSYLICPHCGERIEVFHRGGVTRPIVNEVPLLVEIPLDPAIAEANDTGRPVLLRQPDGLHARRFLELAAEVANRLGVEPKAPERGPTDDA